MPSGGGLSYDHSKLTEVISDFVNLRKIGDIFLLSDITEYISTLPINKYSKRRHHYEIKIGADGSRKPTFHGSASRLSMIEKSEPYFASVIRHNARKWNLRFGVLFAPKTISIAHNKEGYIESVYSAGYCILYCKTDNLGSFSCVGCGKALLLRPQWAYLTKNGKPKVIRKAIKCNECWDKYDLVKIDHTQQKRNSGGAPHWKLKDRFRHWTGEEE